jgi:hypothetical protein
MGGMGGGGGRGGGHERPVFMLKGLSYEIDFENVAEN